MVRSVGTSIAYRYAGTSKNSKIWSSHFPAGPHLFLIFPFFFLWRRNNPEDKLVSHLKSMRPLLASPLCFISQLITSLICIFASSRFSVVGFSLATSTRQDIVGQCSTARFRNTWLGTALTICFRPICLFHFFTLVTCDQQYTPSCNSPYQYMLTIYFRLSIAALRLPQLVAHPAL